MNLAAPGIAWATLLAAWAATASAQNPPCDPNLAGRGLSTFGYQARGTRCEGVYRRPVAATVLYLVSLTEAFQDFDAAAGAPLVVEWAVAADSIQLRAEGLRAELYYQMDAVRPGAARSFEWPTEVLAGLRLQRRDVGIVGWTTRTIGALERSVYVPLRVAPRGATPACGRPRLLLWPGVRLDSITMSVAPVSASGATGAWVTRDAELGLGYYPAQRPIEAALPPLAAGTWLVRLVAHRSGAEAVPVTYYVQLPAAAAPCPGAR